jgi:hypothetical protein
MTIHIGITGTRAGCTRRQRVALLDALDKVFMSGDRRVFFHFGDCVGVDEEAFRIVKQLGFITVSHPPTNPKFHASCKADIIHHPRPYLTRNQDIVDAVSKLFVVPSGPEADNPRSGTWATYRMAVRAGVKTVVIEP